MLDQNVLSTIDEFSETTPQNGVEAMDDEGADVGQADDKQNISTTPSHTPTTTFTVTDSMAPEKIRDIRRMTRHQMMQIFKSKYSIVATTVNNCSLEIDGDERIGSKGLIAEFRSKVRDNNARYGVDVSNTFTKAETILLKKDMQLSALNKFYIWSGSFIKQLMDENQLLLTDIESQKQRCDKLLLDQGRFLQMAHLLTQYTTHDKAKDVIPAAELNKKPALDKFSDTVVNIITQLVKYNEIFGKVQVLESDNKTLSQELERLSIECNAKDNKINDLNNICAQIESNIGDKVDQLCLLSKLERTKKATEIIVVSDEKKEMSPTKLDGADSSAASSSNSPNMDTRAIEIGRKTKLGAADSNIESSSNATEHDISSSINALPASKVVESATAQGSSPASPAHAPSPNISKTTMEIGSQKMNVSAELEYLFKKTEERQKEIRANAPNIIAKLTGSRKAIYDRIKSEGECLKKDFQWKDDINFETLSEDLKFLEDNEVIFRDTSERAHRWRLA